MMDLLPRSFSKFFSNLFRQIRNYLKNNAKFFSMNKFRERFQRKFEFIFFRKVSGRFSLKTSGAWKEHLRSENSSFLLQEQLIFSIIMPTKNRKSHISRAINSVLAQTLNNWELLIVDDSSSDGTYEALLNLFPDPRIRVMMSDGTGVSAARNFGIAQSQGEIIAYLDDDNQWHKDYLEVTLLQMLKTNAFCCYSVQRRFPNGLDNSKGARYLLCPFDLQKLKLFNFIDINIFAHRRSICEELGVFDITLRRFVDWDLIIRYCEKYTPTFCYSVGADYDDSKKTDRISVKEALTDLYVVRNKHLIDWAEIKKEMPNRNHELVSIIICVHNNPDLTEACLVALLRHELGLNFEVIIVDNASAAETVSLLREWALRDPRIRLILNSENMNSSLGNNLGFAMSHGVHVVFLNNGIEVAPELLSSLVAPLANPDIFGVQPMLILPDGSIQNIGLVFSDHSPFPYGLYVGRPGNSPLAARRRRLKALTAGCLAMRASDFLHVGGFDPHYVNELEHVDLCLRIGGGEPVFTCVTEAVVIQHGRKSAGHVKATHDDRKIFSERWVGKISGDDQLHYKRDSVIIESYRPDDAVLEGLGLAVQLPTLVFPKC